MPTNVVGVSGNLSRPSKTRALVETIVGRTVERFDAAALVFDLQDFGPSLGTALQRKDLSPAAERALGAVLDADVLVAASPVYKGSYTGLFKHLLDLLEPAALAGKPVLLAATGGGDRHALVVEHQLRPLFGFFEAATLATGIYAAERDFADGELRSPAVLERIDRAIGQFGLRARSSGTGRYRSTLRIVPTAVSPAI